MTGNTNARVLELDGVRGIAILLVVLHHFGARPPGVSKLLTAPFSMGWSGVDLFFVLSGFLITKILLETRSATNYFKSFYVRRALRIFPLYFLAVVVYFHLALPLFHHLGRLKYWDNSPEPWYWIHLSNWIPVAGQAAGPLGYLWSLAIEEQFYLIWPWVVLLVDLKTLRTICWSLVAASFSLRCLFLYLHLDHHLLFVLTPFRIEPIAVGALVAILILKERRSRATRLLVGTIAVAAFSILLLVISADYRTDGVAVSNVSSRMTSIGYTAWAMLYGCLVFSAYNWAGSQTHFGRQLRKPILGYFAKYGYGIYIIHAPISTVQNALLMQLAENQSGQVKTMMWFANKVIGVALSLALAFVSWNVFEKQFLRLKSRFAPIVVAPDPSLPTPYGSVSTQCLNESDMTGEQLTV